MSEKEYTEEERVNRMSKRIVKKGYVVMGYQSETVEIATRFTMYLIHFKRESNNREFRRLYLYDNNDNRYNIIW